MKLTIDLESRSTVELKKTGMYPYAEHPTTDILCVAFKVDDQPAVEWVPEKFRHMVDESKICTYAIFEKTIPLMLQQVEKIEAHNAGFEYIMWHEIMHKRYGFPVIPLEKLHCSAAKAAAHALPRALGQACEALQVPQQKDQVGYRIMMKMCKPRKPLKAERMADKDWMNKTYWHENPEEFQALIEYCLQDVESEYALSEALRELDETERKLWLIDQEINLRGIQLDIEGINKLIDKVSEAEQWALLEIQQITDGKVTSVRQVQKTLDWLKTKNVNLPNLQKETVEKALTYNINKDCRRLLEIRQSLGKSSVAKLEAMKSYACRDGRARGTMVYHGAAPGRWCLDSESEILTENGWVKYTQWEGEQIAVWDSEKDNIFFETVDINVFDYKGEIISIKNRFLDAKVTLEHKIPYYTSRKNLVVVEAKDCIGKTLPTIPLSSNFAKKSDYAMLDHITRLFVMMQADAYFGKNKSKNRGIVLRFNKKRKIDRCKYLLKLSNIPFRTIQAENSKTATIKISFEDIPNELLEFNEKDFSIIPFGVMNPVIFIDELSFWDGHKQKGLSSFEYSTCNKNNANYACTMAHLAGYSARIIEINREDKGWNTSYRVYIRPTKCCKVLKDCIKLAKYKGKVFCPLTSTGFFLARRNGKIFITGNSGKGIQPHNFPRESLNEWEINEVINMNVDEIDLVYGDAIQTISKCLRGMITADKGCNLFCEDFSAIEARVLAWLANEERTLRAFANGLDLYKVAAMDIYDSDYEHITKGQRLVGKVCVLALGYQGWLGAFTMMGSAYGVHVPEEQAKQIILNWREANPNIVNYWGNIERAAMNTIRDNKVYSYGRIKFGMKDKFLYCRLPSGRMIAYYSPTLIQKATPYGVEKTMISFYGVNSTTKKWVRQETYGGKLTENIVQATARDLLREAIFNVEEAGYKTVFHVHDELVAEVPEGQGNLKEFEQLMSKPPAWADGLPLKAEGYISKRYKKG